MVARRLAMLVSGLLIAAGAWGQGPQLLQPTELVLPVRGEVLAAIAALEEVLADQSLGCRAVAQQLGWDVFKVARYAGGRLSGLGYQVLLARADDSWWLLVDVLPDGREFWVPVIPGIPKENPECHPLGAFLGHVAWQGTEFDPSYLAPEEILQLPANRPPQGQIRFLPVVPEPNQPVKFFGNTFRDPDGVILFYLWDFGDGATSEEMSPTHAYRDEGSYTVTLVLVDDGGAVITFTRTVNVKESPQSECGCG